MRDGDEEAVRWLSYSEIAALRRISRTSAERMVRRAKWRRQVDNQGVTKAAVPLAYAEADRTSPPDGQAESQGDSQAENPPDSALFAALRGAFDVALAAKDEQIQRLETAAATERDRADAFRELAMKNAGMVEAEQAQNAELRVRLEQRRAEAQEARQEVEQLRQADTARRGQGRWTRLKAAWRGE
jgi:hypothetical protein